MLFLAPTRLLVSLKEPSLPDLLPTPTAPPFVRFGGGLEREDSLFSEFDGPLTVSWDNGGLVSVLEHGRRNLVPVLI